MSDYSPSPSTDLYEAPTGSKALSWTYVDLHVSMESCDKALNSSHFQIKITELLF